MLILRLSAVALACLLSALPVALGSEGTPGHPPGTVRLLGPDGSAGAAIERALLQGWRRQGGIATYGGYSSQGLILRGLAALREQAPADLALLDPEAAEAALARGLLMVSLPGEVPGSRLLLPIARETMGACVPIGFDALAIVVPAAASGAKRPHLAALAQASAADQAALPAPGAALGAYLATLLAHAETGNWRQAEAGARRLASLRSRAASEGAPAAAGESGPRTYVGWNSAIRRQGGPAPDLVAAIPGDGAVLRPLLLCVAAGAAHLRGAMALIGYALAAEVQARLAAALYLAPAREGVDLPAGLRPLLPDLTGTGTPLLLPDGRFIARLRAAAFPALAASAEPAGD